MRRILKIIVRQTVIGNVTSLVNPTVVDVFLEERKKKDIEIGELLFIFKFHSF